MKWLLLIPLLITSLSANAWNDRGHMVVAAIAFQELSADKQQALTVILKQHPEYELFWKADFAKLQGDTELGLYLFMRASVWPDKIRDKNHPSHQYDTPKWHYINYELRFPFDGDLKVVDENNVLQAIDLNMDRLHASATSHEKKAIVLCWLIHLIGDLHQPLHSVSLYSNQYPSGDQGGNLYWIKDQGAVRLHAYWDRLLGNSSKVTSVLNETARIKSIHPSITQALNPLDPEIWSHESFKLAREKVYLNGDLVGSIRKRDAKKVPLNYGRETKAIGEHRVAQAGYRLAKIL